MDPKVQLIFFLLALVCFVVSAVWDMEKSSPRALPGVNLVSLGLAFFVVVFAYNAYKAI
ncbi:MAG: hypothetical protein ABI939_01150 [Anaerolineaceae bacterium]